MKRTKYLKKTLSVIVCFALVAAVALTVTSCGLIDKKQESSENVSGEGEMHSFKFTVTDNDGNKTDFNIETDKKTVGDALLDKGLIEGEESQYGLYVKKVNGILADYDTDGTFWAFYEDGNMAAKGADETEIKDGSTYEFRVSK